LKISQFEQVLTINNAGSINLAAEQLYMSQSQLSASIKALEQELGNDIFIRSNKGISLTSFGEEFLPYITSILIQINQLKELSQKNNPYNTKLSVVNGGFRFVSDIIATMYSRYASNGILIEVYDYHNLKAIDIVANQIAEVGILRIWNHQKNIVMKQLKSRDVEFFLLGTMLPTVIVGPKNPLYYQDSDIVSLEQLAPYSPIQMTHMKNNPLGSIYQQFPQINKKNPMFLSSRNMLYEVLPKTDMYCIAATPRRAYQKTPYYPNTRILTLDEKDYSAQLGWIKRRSTLLSDLGHEFIQLLTEYF